jgi:signal transduction histidine kinase
VSGGGEPERERLALLVHEVRSPTAALAAIEVALAGDRLDEESTRELLGLAVAACRGIERIVSDAAVRTLRVEEVDVRAVARAAVATAALHGSQIELVADEDLPGVRGDAARLRQAIDNLIANAAAHSPAEESVVVAVTRRGSRIAISVSDRGPGIAVVDQERIFQPGVRLDPPYAGSGLGLPLARAVAEEHGGTLTVRSAPGAGATFTLVLVAAAR